MTGLHFGNKQVFTCITSNTPYESWAYEENEKTSWNSNPRHLEQISRCLTTRPAWELSSDSLILRPILFAEGGFEPTWPRKMHAIALSGGSWLFGGRLTFVRKWSWRHVWGWEETNRTALGSRTRQDYRAAVKGNFVHCYTRRTYFGKSLSPCIDWSRPLSLNVLAK